MNFTGITLGNGAQPNKTTATLASTSASCAWIPTVSNDGANGLTPATDMNPWDGRNPRIPQLLAGTRIEPPVSVPSAKSTKPQATAEADPLDDPPGTRSGACALRGVP